MKLTLFQKGVLLVSLPMAFEAVFVGALGYQLHLTQVEKRNEMRERQIGLVSGRAIAEVYGLGRPSMAYLRSLGDPLESAEHLKVVNAQVAKIKICRDELAVLMKDDPVESKLFDETNDVANLSFRLYDKLNEVAAEPPSMQQYVMIQRIAAQLYRLADKLYLKIEVLTQRSKTAADVESLKRQEQLQSQITATLAAGFAINVLFSIFLARYVMSDIVKRVQTMQDNARRMTSKTALNPVVPGNDEISQLDQSFHDMADALKKADQTKNEFLAMVSHDMRSPLSAILTGLQLIRAGVYGSIEKSIADQLDNSQESGRRLLNLINDLLDNEVLAQGKLRLDQRPCEIVDLFETAQATVAYLAKEKKVALKTDADFQQVYVDEGRCLQVLVNLLSNALKFTEDDKAITLRCLPPENGFVRIEVSDQGRGIPAENLEHVFERFHQVEVEDGKRGRGSGIGLSIAQKIVEGHGGTIGVESIMGTGSTFWFTLPVCESKSDATATASGTIASTEAVPQ